MPNILNQFLHCANGADLVFEEQESIEYDRKYYNIQKGKTMNKKGRYNMVFRDYGRHHNDSYQQYSIKNFKECYYL